MIIRKAQHKDAANLAVLATHVWLQTYAQDGVKPAYSNYLLEHMTKDRFLAVISTTDNDIWLYEANSALQGFLMVNKASPCPEKHDCLTELDNFYVHSHAARKGIGTALLQQTLSACKEEEISQVWLSVHHKNQTAINFYNKHDFINIGSLMFELEGGLHKNSVLIKIF